MDDVGRPIDGPELADGCSALGAACVPGAAAARARCEYSQHVERVLAGLRFSDEARSLLQAPTSELRGRCGGCGRVANHYCDRCIRSVVPLPGAVGLGIAVHILRDPREPAKNSSVGALPLLSPDIRHHDLAADGAAEDVARLAGTPGMRLVYPTGQASRACEVEWSSVSGVVLIDCKWAQAKDIMGAHPALAQMPALRLETTERSMFWRRELDAHKPLGFVSTLECLWITLRERAGALAQPSGHLDELLLFFALRQKVISEYYANDPRRRCCPWCVDSARMQHVKETSAKKKSAAAVMAAPS